MKTAENFPLLAQNREAFYTLLSRLYLRELDAGALSALQGLTLTGDLAGITALRRALEPLTGDDLEALAADYAGVFLAAGEHQGNGAFPYESVYTSRDRLLMQEAWEAVRERYDARKVHLETEDAGLTEDHLAAELQYMALLAARSAAGDTALLREQADFLENHLLNWTDAFCADVEKYARTDLYRAAAALTRDFLALDRALLRELLAEEAPTEERAFALDSRELDRLLDGLRERYRILGPRATGRRAADGRELVRYGEIRSVSELVTDRPSDFSAKEAWYPVIQTMFTFTESESRESAPADGRGILLFLRPCDVNAMDRLDTIFLQNGGGADLFYARLREKVKVVLLECPAGGFDNCFCVSMGTNRTENYGAALRLDGEKCLLWVKDPALLPRLAGAAEADFAPAFVTENRRAARLPDIRGREDVRLAGSLPFWEEYNDRCIGCGGCNTVCPTCSCFDTVDVIYDDTGRAGERRRVWSSCMLDTFTLTAGGGRSRSTPGQNLRFKALHKVYDYRQRFGTEGHMCVGCGRCILRCPKDIDFLDTVNRFTDELEKAKAGREAR